MAVDSASKRYSMLTLGHHIRILTIPDGTIAEADRAHLVGLYSGIALDEPVIILRGNFRRHAKKPRRWK